MKYLNIYFLDVVDAGVSSSVNKTLLFVIGATILVEALTMLLMKYNKFGPSLFHSFIINTASVAAGYLLFWVFPEMVKNYSFVNLFILMLITMVVEVPLLYLLNKKTPFMQTLKTGIVINFVSYFLFFLFINFTQR